MEGDALTHVYQQRNEQRPSDMYPASTENEERTVKQRKYRSTRQKVVETGALVASWIVMGMYCEVSGPTLIDLKHRFKAGYEELAVALSAGGAGTIPGCILGGILVDKFGAYCHLMIAVTLDIAAICVVLMPWVPALLYLWTLCFISGLVETIHNTAGTRINLNIWKDKSASPIILMHLGYGIGSFLAPLYSNPFLGVKIYNTSITNETFYGNVTIEITSNYSDFKEEMSYLENSRVEYAFAISGIAAACLSIVFYILQVVESKALKQIQNETGSIKSNGYIENDNTIEVNGESNKSYLNILRGYDWRNKLRGLLQMFNPAACAKGRFWYGSSILFVVFFYFGNAGGGQGFTSKFIRSFSIDQLHFTNTDASLLNTSFWISFSAGRFIFFIIARMMSVKLLLLLETSTLMVFAIFLAIFGCDNSTALWVLTQVVAFCIGPLWPTGIAWTDYHIELTGMAMALQMVGCAFGYMLHMRLIGYLYDSFGPHTYVLHVAGSAILGFILAVVLAIIGAKHGNRFVPENISDTDGRNDIDFSEEKENEKSFTKTDVTML